MRRILWPPQWHTRLATIIGFLLAFIGFGSAVAWPDTNNGNNLNAALVHLLVIPATMVTLYVVGHAVDRRYPEAALGEAVLRLFVPFVVILVGCWWLVNKGIFTDELFAFVPIGGAALVMMGIAVAITRPWEHASASPEVAATTPTATAARLDPTSPPPWPTAPPVADSQAYQPPAWTAPPLLPPPPTGKPRAHVITSALITVGWIPLGLLFLFVLNWCPDEGTGDAVWVLSLLFVIVQLAGNPIAGVLLDRRYGRTGGALLAVGRSFLVATILTAVSLTLLLVLIPSGSSRYCG